MEKIPAACAMEWSVELEKGLRSKIPGRPLESILRVGDRLEQWCDEPEPTMAVYSMYGLVPGEERLFANTVLLRLADAFVSGDGEVKRAVVSVFRRLKRRSGGANGILSKARVNNPTELLRRVKVVFDGGDVESRAMALVMFGCWADFAKDSAHVRYLILSSLVSSEVLVVKASLFAAGCFCELVDDFALVCVQILTNLLTSLDTPSTVRLAGVRLFSKMSCCYSIANGAFKTGLELFLGSSDEVLRATMITSLSKLACASLFLVSEQVDLLFSNLDGGQTLLMQEISLRCLYGMYRRKVCHFPDASHVQKLLRVINDQSLPSSLQCLALRILYQVRLFLLPGMLPVSIVDFSKALSDIGSQFSMKSKSLLALFILADVSIMLRGRTEEGLAGALSSLPSQVVSSCINWVLSVVLPLSNFFCAEPQVFNEVKIMLKLLLRMVSKDPNLGAFVLDKFIIVIGGILKEHEDSLGLSEYEVAEYMKEKNILRRSNLMLLLCRFSMAVLEVMEQAGAFNAHLFENVKVLVKCNQQRGIFVPCEQIMCSVLLYSRLIRIFMLKKSQEIDEDLCPNLQGILAGYRCFIIECVGKILAEKDYWAAYNAGFYAACQGTWFTANSIFADLMTKVQSKSHRHWLTLLAQFSLTEMKIQVLFSLDRGSSLVEHVEKSKLPVMLVRDGSGKTGEDAAEAVNSFEFGETVLEAYSYLQSLQKTLQSLFSAGEAFFFQTWFLALRVKLLEAIFSAIRFMASVPFGEGITGNNKDIERNGDKHMIFLQKLTLISSQLMKLSKEFDLLAVSFIGIDIESLKIISTLALSCSLLSFSTGFCLFIPSLTSAKIFPSLENSENFSPPLLLQNLFDRLCHSNHETARSLLSLMDVDKWPKSCSHLLSNDRLLASSWYVRELVSICHDAVSRVLDLRNEPNGVQEEFLAQIVKVGRGILMNVIGKFICIPFCAPKYYFKIRPRIGAELFAFNADSRHTTGLYVLEGFQLSLNLCLQVKNIPSDLPALPKSYCIIHCTMSSQVSGPSGEQNAPASSVQRPWETDDVVVLSEKLFHHVIECGETNHIRKTQDGTASESVTTFVHFDLNNRGQGFSKCLLDVSRFPPGTYRFKWHSCCIDSQGSYWSFLPLNQGLVITIE